MRLAFCGVIAALSTAVLFLTGVLPVATLAAPALAGLFLIAVVAETDIKHGFGTYFVVCVLAALVAPDREAALIFVLFFGYYPVLYGLLSRMKNVPVRYLLKFLLFNFAMVLDAVLAVFVLGIPAEEFFAQGRLFAAVLLIAANVVFAIYDFSINGLIVFYIRRLHPFVRKYLK